jgi:hypothetical protein
MTVFSIPVSYFMLDYRETRSKLKRFRRKSATFSSKMILIKYFC